MKNTLQNGIKIMALLPGVDCNGCGGCGFEGCEACATAIIETGKVDMCPACDNETIKAIAEVLGVEPVTVEPKMAYVHCNGDAAAKERLKDLSSCKAAKEAGFLFHECQWGCLGHGDCVKNCEFEAMQLVDGKIEIDREKCTGCMACMAGCPQKIINMVPKDATNFIPCSSKAYETTALETCGHACIGCGECELCQRGAGEYCRSKTGVSGAFCEYVEIPMDFVKKGVIRLPSADEAFTLVEPLACVLSAMDKMNITEKSNVMIAGGGPMGTLFALVLTGKNIAVTVSEPSAERRELLASFGINAIDPATADPSKYDNIAVAVGIPALVEDYVKKIADNGTIHVFAGLPKDAQFTLDPFAIHYRGVTVTGSSGFTLETFHTAYEMSAEKPDHFRKLITHKFDIEDAVSAFETQASGRAFKVLIKP